MSVKKVLKAVVRGFQAILPEPVFNAVYDFTFPIYKECVRWLYYLKGLLLYSWSSSEKWKMTRKIHSILPYTLVGIGGLEATYCAVKKVNELGIEGDCAELGVARGGCATLIGRAMFDEDETPRSDRTLWLFDSYEGLPEPTEEDFDDERGAGTGDHVRPLPKGSCLGTLPQVQELLFDKMGLPKEHIRFAQGWFEDTVPRFSPDISKLAILRIDGDWYESTKVCLNGLYDKVEPGGVIIIDDYHSCYGCEKALTEFLSERNLHPEIHLDGRGGCYFEKSA